MTDAFLLALVPGLPLAATLLFALGGLRPLALALVPLAPLAAVAAAVSGPQATDLPWLGIGARFEVTGVRGGFLLFTAILWSLAGATAVAYLRADPHRARFCVLFLIAMAGNLGLIVAADAMSFYAFFAMMSIASWGLVLHEQSDFARFAGRTYIAFAIAGELALFAGFALAAGAAGSTLLADLAGEAQPGLATALLLIGFGIKLGAVPLHLWLPLAHAAAPAPASAVLSGAMIKAGLFGMIVALPFGAVAMPDAGALLVAFGGASIVVAAFVGVTQANPKAVLAYSSVGQMGLIAMALGVALAAPEIWPAVLPALAVFAAHHAFAKAALFLGVPAFWSAKGPRARAAVLALLVLPAAALAAAPWTSGAFAKGAILDAWSAARPGWSEWLYPLVVGGSIGTTLLMARFLILMSRQPAKAGMTPALMLPWAAMAGVAVAGFWLLPFGLGGPKALSMPDVAPVAGGILVALGVAAILRQFAIETREVPPGEVLALFQSAPAEVPPPIAKGSAVIVRRGHLPRALPEFERAGGFALLGIAALLVFAALGLS
jgi:formate hydrogenlyase subunit 3/multisubunit Na+/H+ antiporter MnhD subunit